MIDYPRREYPSKGIRARSVVAVGRDEYNRLREPVAEDIRSRFDSRIHPVQWGGIMFRRLNRECRP
jgi:hypothetical protein